MNQLGILVGQQFGKRYFRFNYLAGPAYLWGHKEISQTYKTTDSWGNSIYKTNTFSMLYGAIGVELKVGCHWLLTRYFGLGFDIHGNINADRPVFFPVINLEFGKLRGFIEK